MPTITTDYLGDMLFESVCGNHRVSIDVPLAMGGNDRGPQPPELFAAALGSCIAAFVATYCEQHGIAAQRLSVDVSFKKAGKPDRLANLSARINLPYGDFRGREQALLHAAEQCILHETLANFAGLRISLVCEQPEATAAEAAALPMVC